MSMNARHAAALAFVGWYLMLPPPASDHQGTDTTAPLSIWFRAKPVYETKADCERDKAGLIALKRENPSSPAEQMKLEGEKAGLCVSSDDPRLKGN
jgi:hypothetical protein